MLRTFVARSIFVMMYTRPFSSGACQRERAFTPACCAGRLTLIWALLILDSGRLEGIEMGEFDDRMPVFSG